MRRGLRFLIAVPIALGLAPPAGAADPAAASFAGYWSGVAEAGSEREALAIRLAGSGAGLVGTVDWPAMGYLRADLLSARQQDGGLRLSVPLPLGSLVLQGIASADGLAGTIEKIGQIEGEWRSQGVAGRFELHRAVEPALPYAIEQTTFANGNATLAGSLFLPRTGARHAGVVYIAGSGDTTRGDGSFLADSLARAGIATLVYDKRGAGQSGGNWREGGFDELAGDAGAALRMLQQRAEIDPRRTGFVCQSQGCWVAPIALRAGAAAHFLVAQSGPAVTVRDEDLDFYRVLLEQQGYGERDVQAAFALVTKDQQVSLGSASWGELQAAIAAVREQPWFGALHYEPAPADDPERVFSRHTLPYDPAADIGAIRVPSLWIYGEADRVIPVASSIASLRAAAAQPAPTIRTLPGAGHSFTCDNGSIPQLAAGYPGLVAEWIAALPSTP